VVDHAALATVLDEFSATVTGEFSVEDILRQLAEAAVRILGVDGAGVMAPYGESMLRFTFATDGKIAAIERLQEELQAGPCRDANLSGQVVSVDDLALEGHWPEYQTRAVEVGAHAVTAIPLRARGRSWGVLDVYRAAPGGLDEAELAAAATLANLATSYLVVTADRDLARRVQDELAHQAMHDPLTGLPVRWVFLEQLAVGLARLRRQPGRLAVLFVDLDGLKYVNDTYGHLAGDRLIQTCAERIRAALRPADVLARIGGDEFVILLEAVGGPEDAVRVAQRILAQLSAPYRPDGETIQPSASIGIVVTDDPDVSEDTLVSHADAAMYRAKHEGPGRYDVFDPAAYAAERDSITTRDGLRAALRSGQLELFYQPIIDLTAQTPSVRFAGPSGPAATGMWAVEALARWRHPTRGLLAATDFISAAERTAVIFELGAWALRTACNQLAAWDAVLGAAAPPRLFVNISVGELVQPDLVELVADALDSAGIAADRLTLEITESGLFTDHHAIVAVQALRRLGCELAIDDFGTGYSSLSRLVQIPAASLKTDQSFARALRVSGEARAVISAVVLLGATLGRTVIVEGVEDAATLAELRQLGATHAQGFQLAAPQHPDDITATLKG